MEVKSDLSGVWVGDELVSLHWGQVLVTEVTGTHISGRLSHWAGDPLQKWTLGGHWVHTWSPQANESFIPDLYYPGVQVIPAAPPKRMKRMKRVTVERWVALYLGLDGQIISWSRPTKDGFPPDFIGEIKHVIWEVEVEADD